jgi:hypothetical protein
MEHVGAVHEPARHRFAVARLIATEVAQVSRRRQAERVAEALASFEPRQRLGMRGRYQAGE